MKYALILLFALSTSAIAAPPMPELESQTHVRQTNITPSATQTETAQISNHGTSTQLQPATIETRPSGTHALDLQQVPTRQTKDGDRPLPQISAATDSRSAPIQLAPSGQNAQALPALTLRSEGRNTNAAPLVGSDRCDPRANGVQNQRCAAVIENRVADYPVPDHQPLSPEQRLLASQRQAESVPTDLDSAARRLSTGQSDDSLAGQAIASLTFSAPPPKEKERDISKSPEAGLVDAIVAGIVLQAAGLPGPN